ncbi:MAG: alpha/beta fold hydrolase [Clostridiales bacterium]|nr:alpha/beta fold hydrolase [Clostridiales bacterium]
MDWYYVLLIVVASIALLFYIVAPVLIYKMAFGHRYDKNASLKYFSASDFGLNAKEVKTQLYGKALNGYLYSVKPIEECSKLVIFQHGMGAGQCAYTTEIATLAKAGFAVLAFDAFGCDLSEGSQIKGLYAGADCVVAAYNFAKQSSRLKGLPVCLVGHSWGAYSVLCASEKIKVEKVVALSAPNNPNKLLADMLKSGIFRPVWWLCNLFSCGKNGNKSAVSALKGASASVLLIHGKQDKTVGENNAVANLISGKGITVLIEEDKGHNPYNTVEAEKRLAQLNQALVNKEQKEYFDNFDFTSATEEDEEVIKKIIDFLQ